LPDAFVKSFQGKEFKLARVGKVEEDRWTVDGTRWAEFAPP
jgi:hypothetical protein